MTTPAHVSPAPNRRRSRRWRTARLLTIISIPCLLLTFCVGTPGYYVDKYSSAGPAHPVAFPVSPIPELQTEPHTCGLHALSSLYHAYSLDPDRLKLRFRIGVDTPLSNFMPKSLGTIHPDMLRVLWQDGFQTELVRPGSSAAAARLADHLTDGHMALALIRVKEFHWVLLGGTINDKLIICDSLHESNYPEPLDTYLRDRIYSLLLVKPR
jgi:hypothetical protein